MKLSIELMKIAKQLEVVKKYKKDWEPFTVDDEVVAQGEHDDGREAWSYGKITKIKGDDITILVEHYRVGLTGHTQKVQYPHESTFDKSSVFHETDPMELEPNG